MGGVRTADGVSPIGRTGAAPRFLVIQLRQIGDVVLTTPIPRILKEAVPGGWVAFLTEPPSHKLLEGNPNIDQVFLNNRRGSIWESLSLARRLRRERFDAVLDFMANPRSALLTFLSGAPMRISYPSKGRGILYTHRVPAVSGYAVEIKKSLLGPLGISSERNLPEIFLSEVEQREAQTWRNEWLAEASRERLVTVDPSHRRAQRRWPAQHYGDLCRDLASNLGALPVVLWGPGEEPLAREVVSRAGGAARMAPATNLRQLSALIRAADLHVGNCSAPRHIAVAVGTPSFTVLGATSWGWTHPAREHAHLALGLDCQPCNRNACDRDVACLRELEPGVVFAALREWTRSSLGWQP